MWFLSFLLVVAVFDLTVDARVNRLFARFTNTTTQSPESTTLLNPRSVLKDEPPAMTPALLRRIIEPNGVCCFVVQDVVSEEWWQSVSSTLIYKTANLTKITAHITSWPGTTATSYEVHVQPTYKAFSVTIPLAFNPISLLDNIAPHPTEVAHSNLGDSITTAGVIIQSPAAFYVYSTVKVITASAITDRHGNLACGTSIGGFPDMNPNAQAYFDNGVMRRRNQPVGTGFRKKPATPVVIPLTTPFIYQPDRGRIGATASAGACDQRPGTEEYGYVPQTLLDFLVGNPHYVSQYPGLAACLPGGPSIRTLACSQSAPPLTTIWTTFTTTPLVRTTLTYSNRSSAISTKISVSKGSTVTSVITSYVTSHSISTGSTRAGPSTIVSMSKFTLTFKNSTIVDSTEVPVSTQTAPVEESTVVVSNPVVTTQTRTNSDVTQSHVYYSHAPVAQTTDVPGQAVVVTTAYVRPQPSPAINPPANHPPGYKVAEGPSLTDETEVITTYETHPAEKSPGPNQSPDDRPQGPDQIPLVPGVIVVVPSTTTVPASALISGFPGQTTEIGGTQVVILDPTTFFRHSAVPADNIPGASATVIHNTAFIVITSSTNVPVVNAPSALTGSTTVINNTPFLVIPGPTTFMAPTQAPGPPGFPASTTFIDGTPFVVIPGSTNIPVASAPRGLTGSLTIINNTPFLVVPSATNVPVAQQSGVTPPLGSTVTINGTPMLLIPGPTNVPLSQAPSGLGGATTTIDGVPFLVVPGTTSIPVPSSGPGSPTVGTTTLINGTPFLVIPGATQIPVSNAPPGLAGASTTIINGTPFLVIPSATTVPLQTSPGNIPGAITSTINGVPVLIFPSATSIPLSLASGITGGTTTIINGTPFLVIPGPTTVANPAAQITAPSSRLTVINGVTSVVIDGRKTIAFDPRFPISGSTTVIDGTTMVVVGQLTTVPLDLTTTSSSATQTSKTSSSTSASRTSTSSTSKSTSTTTEPTTTPQPSTRKGLSTGAKVGIAFGVIFGALLIIGLAVWFLRRGQRYQPVQQTAGQRVPGQQGGVQQTGWFRAQQYHPVQQTSG